MTNVGRLPLTFNFDKKILANIGLTIEPDKVQKLLPNTSVQFNVAYTTKKNAKHQQVIHAVPIDVKYGPTYNVLFTANLTIPELTMSSENVDFEKVCVGTRKIIKLRFSNEKEVPCEWSYFFKTDNTTQSPNGKDIEKFQVFPDNGSLLPGQKQVVDIIFTPTQEKLIN